MVNNQKVILTDFDGCCGNWDQAFQEFMFEKGYSPILNSEKYYRLAERYPCFTDAEIFEFVNELNTSERIAHLQPFRDSVKYIKKLHSEGYTFICITALSDKAEARIYREQNLDNLFDKGVFDHSQMVCLKPRDSKYHSLKKWAGTGLYWIEDHFIHAESGHELGLKPILMSNPYNEQFKTDLFPRVNSWKEIYNIITAEQKTTSCDMFCTLGD